MREKAIGIGHKAQGTRGKAIGTSLPAVGRAQGMRHDVGIN
jgi:hypothetical protein